MKKSTLLSLLTATSITLTTAGTYAAWDSVTAESSKAVTFRNPVTVEVGNQLELTDIKKLGDLSVSGEVSFTINDTNSIAKKLKIVPEVVGSDVTIEDFVFEIVDKNESSTPTLNETEDDSNEFVDETLNTTNYIVKVTPQETAKGKIEGKEVSIKLTATLE